MIFIDPFSHCAPYSPTIHEPQMKDDIIGICYTISVIPSSIMLYVALTKCIVNLLLFILTFVSLYLCLTKCYLSIRYSFHELYTFLAHQLYDRAEKQIYRRFLTSMRLLLRHICWIGTIGKKM